MSPVVVYSAPLAGAAGRTVSLACPSRVVGGRDTSPDRWRSFLELSGREMAVRSLGAWPVGPKWTHLLTWSPADASCRIGRP